MTTRTSRQTRRMQEIVETDRRQAVAKAEDDYQAECVTLAPLSYAQLREARDAGTLAELLATVPAYLLRAQAVRFLVERKEAHGALWGWGDVEDIAGRFDRLAATVPPPAPPAGTRTPEERARDRAELRLSQGAVVEPVSGGAYLVASNSRSNLVHRVADGVCSCEARGVCWHLAAVELVEEARIEDEAQREWARRGPTPQWAA